MMHTLWLKIFSILFVLAGPGIAAQETTGLAGSIDLDRLSKEIQSIIGRAELGRFRGAVVVRVGDDQVISDGYGLENRELSAIDPSVSLFDVGSVAKSVTAATVLRLVEQGKIELSTTMREVFGDDAGNLSDITVHDLLRHRSGLGSGGSALSQAGSLDSADALIAALGQAQLGAKQFAYSNIGYFVLAAVIEEVGDGVFEDVTRRLVLEPSGLSGVGFVGDGEVPGARPTARVSRAPRGLPSVGSLFDYPWNWGQRGATGVVMTAQAAADWVEAIDAGEWLRPESRAAMLAPSTDGYGLGFYVDVNDDGRVTRFWHGGSTRGYVCQVARYPIAFDGRGATVVIMAEASIEVSGIARQIGSLLWSEPAKPTFAGVYLSRYADLSEKGVYTISGSIQWRGMPQYVGSDGINRITDSRPTIILEDSQRRMWPLMIRLDHQLAENLIAELQRVGRSVAEDPEGGQTPWSKGISLIVDTTGFELNEHDSLVLKNGATVIARSSPDHHEVLIVQTPDGHEVASVRMGGAESRRLQEELRRALR
ncbi:MAG: serine hydrolase domain-containing protein [Planctomycetota bacterium]